MPRSWLQPTQNLLVVFEEIGGDAMKISLVKRSTSIICGDMYEFHPLVENWDVDSDNEGEDLHRPELYLHCNVGQTISAIKFASFGKPLGTCGSFVQGSCHSTSSQTILEKVVVHFFFFL